MKKQDTPIIIDETPIEEPAPETAEKVNPVVQPVQSGTSEDTKTLVTVLTLIFLTPIGVVIMWIWPKWKAWVKSLVTCVACCPVIIIGAFFLLTSAFIALLPLGMDDIETQFDSDSIQQFEDTYDYEYYLPEEEPMDEVPQDLPLEEIPEAELEDVTY